MAQVLDGHILKWIVKEPRGFFHKVPTGYFAEWIVKELKGFFHKVSTEHFAEWIVKVIKGFFHKVPTGHCAELFSKVFTLYPVNIGWANCFRTHNEPTLYPLGKWPLAPSDTGSLLNMWYVPSVSPSLETGLPSIGTRCCQTTFWWEDVHQAVIIHELRPRPQRFLSPNATSRRPSVSANRTDGDSGYQQHGNYPSVPPMGLV